MHTQRMLSYIEKNGADKVIDFLGIEALMIHSNCHSEGAAFLALERFGAEKGMCGQVIYEIYIKDNNALLDITFQSLFSEQSYTVELLNVEDEEEEDIDSWCNDITALYHQSQAEHIIEQFNQLLELNLLKLNIPMQSICLNQFFEL